MHKSLHLIAWVGAATLLAACGGNDEVTLESPDTVPASATASPQAFTRYAAALPEDDRREPLHVEGLVPPTSETDEPVALTR